MPEQIIGKIKKSITAQWKACFVAALVMGLFAHLYKITNWLPNWDSLVFRYDAQNMIAMGRFFLPIACAPSSFYDLPLVAGGLAIIFHALGAVCICKMFDVRKTMTAVLVGASVATFPTVTSVMMYNYVADGYALAFLFSCIAAMLIAEKKPRYVASIVLIALSSGIYQAYITVTVMLLLMFMITELLHRGAEIKKVVLFGVRALIVGALGMALYYLLLNVLLKITGTELLSYQGFDSAASLSGINIFGALYTIKESFFDYFFNFADGVSAFLVINCVVLILTVSLCISDIIRNKLSFAKIFVLTLLALLLPIGASVLAFVNSSIDYHNLMKMGFVVFYLFMILAYERSEFRCEKLLAARSWAILIVVVVFVFNNIIIANISYHKLNMAYEKSYGVMVRIADRIEQTEGSGDCEKILVLGSLADSEAYSAHLPPDMTGTTDGFILRADDEVVGQSVLCSAINDYCGKEYGFVAGEEKANILSEIKEESLEIWPDKNSISVHNGVIVIKLGDEE